MAKKIKSNAAASANTPERPYADQGKALDAFLRNHHMSVEKAAALAEVPAASVSKMLLGKAPSEHFMTTLRERLVEPVAAASTAASAKGEASTAQAATIAVPVATAVPLARDYQPYPPPPANATPKGTAMRLAYGRKVAKERAAKTDWLRHLDASELRALGEACAAEIPARREAALRELDAQIAALPAQREAVAGGGR